VPDFSAGEAALNLHVPGIACEHLLRIMRKDSGVLCRLWGLALNVIGMNTPFGKAEATAIKAVPDVSYSATQEHRTIHMCFGFFE